jgi:hypothetical protein
MRQTSSSAKLMWKLRAVDGVGDKFHFSTKGKPFSLKKKTANRAGHNHQQDTSSARDWLSPPALKTSQGGENLANGRLRVAGSRSPWEKEPPKTIARKSPASDQKSQIRPGPIHSTAPFQGVADSLTHPGSCKGTFNQSRSIPQVPQRERSAACVALNTSSGFVQRLESKSPQSS